MRYPDSGKSYSRLCKLRATRITMLSLLFGKITKAPLFNKYYCKLSNQMKPGNQSNSVTKLENRAIGSKPRVLIIDDDETLREAIGFMLEEFDIEFDSVASGEEGLTRLDKNPYGLIFLDLVLSTGANGIEIFKKLQERAEKVPVVLMTASASREPIHKAASELQGFVLKKPFSSDEFGEIIRETLKNRLVFGQ